MPNENFIPGVIDDPRSHEEKLRDYPSLEIAYTSSPLVWTEKKPKDWKKYFTRNQNGGGYCVGEGTAKGFELWFAEICSSVPLYRNRANYPARGMWLQDVGNVAKKIGTTLEKNIPSQKLTDAQIDAHSGKMDGIPDTEIFKVYGYAFLRNDNIDAIAEIIASGKPVIFTFHTNSEEWKDVPEYKGKPATFGHCVCGTDYTLYKGEKAIVVDESWGKGITEFGDKRVITESFLKARCTGAMYFLEKPPEPPKPKHMFLKNLSYGAKGMEVEWLQKVLVHEGVLKPIFITGNYLGKTKEAVIKFQEKYAKDILTPIGLTKGTGRVLEQTRKKLNELYG
jgi:hypothetical protein